MKKVLKEADVLLIAAVLILTVIFVFTPMTRVAKGDSIYIDAAPPTYFGLQDLKSSSYPVNDKIIGSPFMCPVNAVANSITVYLVNKEGSDTTFKYKCALYSYDDQSLVGTAEEKTITLLASGGSDGWYTFNMDTTANLVANTWYIIMGAGSDGTEEIPYSSWGGNQIIYNGAEYIPWPNPLVIMYNKTGQTMAFYCTITATSSASSNTNNPPIADAGPDQTLEQISRVGAVVTLDGSGSYDPEGNTLTYDWAWVGGSATGVSPTVTLPLGTTTVTLTVSDEVLTGSDTVNIKVEDTTPPVITLSSNQIILRPPNDKYQTIRISDFVLSVTDICDATLGIANVKITSVSSDEPKNAKGDRDGNTRKDIVIHNAQTVKLRAERDEKANGRVYTINFKVNDLSGNTATGCYKIWVLKSQAPKWHIAIDDGASAGYTVYYP